MHRIALSEARLMVRMLAHRNKPLLFHSPLLLQVKALLCMISQPSKYFFCLLIIC